MECSYPFYSPPKGGDTETDPKRSPKANKEKHAEQVTGDTIRIWILEFVAKTTIDVDPYTLGEILYMINAREEELQIGWACSAQAPDLLPEKYKNKSGSSKSTTAKSIKAVFE